MIRPAETRGRKQSGLGETGQAMTGESGVEPKIATMNVQEFEHTTSRKTPPAGISPMLEALWFVRKGDWGRAHAIVQTHESEPTSALVHAHLHRIEGDLSNAGYWYGRAGSKTAQIALEEEWKALTARFLEEKK